jgi:hypothetical protein
MFKIPPKLNFTTILFWVAVLAPMLIGPILAIIFRVTGKNFLESFFYIEMFLGCLFFIVASRSKFINIIAIPLVSLVFLLVIISKITNGNWDIAGISAILAYIFFWLGAIGITFVGIKSIIEKKVFFILGRTKCRKRTNQTQ